MTVTLMCSKSPWFLGIVDNYRMINLDKLHDHVDNCKICREYYNTNTFKRLEGIINDENQEQCHLGVCATFLERYQMRKQAVTL
jgi:hypothetical protein